MSDFTVNRQQLDDASGQFDQLSTTASGIKSTLDAVPLVQSDFGRVPWLQSRVWEAYQEHSQDCTSSLEELKGALDNVSDGLEATAIAYRAMDDDAEQAAGLIMQNLEAGPA